MLYRIKYFLYKNIGQYLLKNGRKETALRYFSLAQKSNPYDLNFTLKLTDLYIDFSRIYDAKYLLKNSLFKTHPEILLSRAKLHEYEEDWLEALECYGQLIKKNDKHHNDKHHKGYIGAAELIRGNAKNSKNLSEFFFKRIDGIKESPEKLYYAGLIHTYCEDHYQAIQNFLRARERGFDAHKCYQALGTTYILAGDFNLAISYFQKTLEINPNCADAYVNLGKIYELSSPDTANDYFSKALKIEPDNYKAVFSQANIALRAENYDLALELFEQAEELNPSSPECAYQIGELYLSKDELDEAVYFFELALTRDKILIPAAMKLAHISKLRGNTNEAIDRFRKLYEQSIAFLDAGFFLQFARLYEESKNLDDSIATLETGISKHPLAHELWNALSVQQRERGETKKALSSIDTALNLHLNSPIYLANKAIIVAESGNYEEALMLFDRAEKIGPGDPNLFWLRAIAHLQNHDFQNGWRDYSYRWKRVSENQKRPFKYPEYKHKASEGTVLVYREQGLGDEIMFSSCLHDLHKLKKNIIVECDPKLNKLFSRSFSFATIYSSKDRNNIEWTNQHPNIKSQIAIGSLPYYFRNNLEDFQGKAPYILADKNRVAYWKEKLDSLGYGLKIGLSWRGGTHKTRKLVRSLDTGTAALLLDMPNAKFINLQYGGTDKELHEIAHKANAKIYHFPDAIEDYDETAALCSALDIVISVQTAIVHLCGALGVTTLAMLPQVAEWRYGAKGIKMPWYNSVRLFRQSENSDWPKVIKQVKNYVSTELL